MLRRYCGAFLVELGLRVLSLRRGEVEYGRIAFQIALSRKKKRLHPFRAL